MKKILTLIIIICSLNAIGQDQSISKELKERYYSSTIKIGELNKILYDSLKIANTDHPARFYEICGSFIQDSMLNEAAVVFFIGLNRYKIYNKTNPNYKASEDGALAGSFAYAFGQVFDQYLNQNLDNFSVLLQKSGEWYRDNKHVYFKTANYDSLYQVQTMALLNQADEFKNNPFEYINNMEKARKELEEMMNEGIEIPEDEIVAEEMIEEEGEPQYRPTSEIPEAFFSNYNDNYFIVNQENEISAVAHGYYDTYIESPDAEIIKDKHNSLHYKIKPRKEGKCIINLYGVSEKGSKIQLATYTIKVIKK